MVHNHGPEDGPGLSCPEFRLRSGEIKGECLMPKITHHIVNESGKALCTGQEFKPGQLPVDTLLRLCEECLRLSRTL